MLTKVKVRGVAVAILIGAAASSVAISGKPRMVRVLDDGSTYETTQNNGGGRGSPKASQPTEPAPPEGDPIGDVKVDPPTQDTGYVTTLSPTYTPDELNWAGRPWRVNTSSTDFPDLPYSLMRSKNWNRLRFEVRADEPTTSSKAIKRRAELSGSVYGDKTRLPMGKSLWGAFSTIQHPWSDPEGMRKTYGMVFGQIHMGSKVGGSPALAFRRLHNGRFRITTRGEFDDGGSTRFEGDLSWGQAHDIVYNVTLDPKAARLRVWVDRQLIVNLRDVSIGHSIGDSYWNVGVYAPGGVTNPVIAELANHVYPAAFDLSARTTQSPPWPQD